MTPLEKLSALLPEVQLQPHQQELVEQAKTHPQRMLLMHSLGSGKTLSAIGMAEAQNQPYTAVVPAALRNNFRGERAKFTDQQTPADVASYTSIAKGDPISKLHTLIFDEAHRLRNPGSKQTQRAMDLADQANQVIMLSGTPVINRPSDIVPMVNMLTGRRMSPEEFEGRYVGEKKKWPGIIPWLRGVQPVTEPEIRNEDELKALLQGHIDYYAPDQGPVPVNRTDIPVEMGTEQSRLYKAMWNELPWMLRWKLKNDFPMNKEELSKALSFLTGPRQVSLSTYPYLRSKDPEKAFVHSPKLQEAHKRMMEKLKDERTKGLVFSNFIDAGLTPYSYMLNKNGIPAAVFHGGLNDLERKRLVDDYNRNKLRVALLGPSGAEGLSFKGTQLIQILDPHWNAARTRQMEGRGLRHDSHWNLPPELQNVEIQRYISKMPPGFQQRLMAWLGQKPEPGRASDDYLIAMSQKKDDLSSKFLSLLRDMGAQNRKG